MVMIKSKLKWGVRKGYQCPLLAAASLFLVELCWDAPLLELAAPKDAQGLFSFFFLSSRPEIPGPWIPPALERERERKEKSPPKKCLNFATTRDFLLLFSFFPTE